jgi:hypothetical protein
MQPLFNSKASRCFGDKFTKAMCEDLLLREAMDVLLIYPSTSILFYFIKRIKVDSSFNKPKEEEHQSLKKRGLA